MYSVTIAALYLKFPLITNTTTHIVRNENEDVFRWSQKTAQHLFTILFHLLLVILLAFIHLLRTTHVEYTWYQKHIRRKTTVSYQAKEWRTKTHNSTHISETMRQCKHKKTVHGIFVRSRPVYIKAFRHLYYTTTTLEVTGREKKEYITQEKISAIAIDGNYWELYSVTKGPFLLLHLPFVLRCCRLGNMRDCLDLLCCSWLYWEKM